MRIVCISDTHSQHEAVRLPEGNLLIHAGDYTYTGSRDSKNKFFDWFAKQNFKYKLLIAGNHDFGEPKVPRFQNGQYDTDGFEYLYESRVEIDGVKFWGSPWTPQFGRWAFMYDRAEGKEYWDKISLDTDVVITHGPARGFRDRVAGWGEQVGCDALRDRILEVKPKLHVFGHIHGSYGQESFNDTTFVNASVCNEAYAPVNEPIVFDLE